ncbi:hypothetical protein AB0K40_11230 [Nonomuraea bangladeshensis]|uniref:Uncharacterized protein n=1 Tax=Nonomuraea bangladeshensis TaxID=404385 RepID=A0ABV3H177_9ACTN
MQAARHVGAVGDGLAQAGEGFADVGDAQVVVGGGDAGLAADAAGERLRRALLRGYLAALNSATG